MATKSRIEKLRGMAPAELSKEERELREQLWKLRVQRATGQLTNLQKVRQVRRELARVLTVRRQQELAGGGGV